MRRLVHAVAATAATAALALPVAAQAKEIGSLKVCGPDHCHAVNARAAMSAFLEDGYETLAPKTGGAFYEVRARVRHENEDAGGFTVLYVPAAGLLRAEAEYGKHRWLHPAGVTARALRRAAKGLRPYPADQLGPVREPLPAPAASPPARVSSPASGDGSERLGLAGGAGALAVALLAAALLVRRRRQT